MVGGLFAFGWSAGVAWGAADRIAEVMDRS